MRIETFTFHARDAKPVLSVDGRDVYNLVVGVPAVPSGFPYGPNARNAKPTAKTVRAMLETLRTEPEEFFFYNGGILLLAHEIAYKKIDPSKGGGYDITLKLRIPSEDEVKTRLKVEAEARQRQEAETKGKRKPRSSAMVLDIPPIVEEVEITEGDDFIGDGIVNGGHTYKALTRSREKILRYPRISEALVNLTVLVGVPEQYIPKISQARNTSEKVSLSALRHLAGDWDILEDNLPDRLRDKITFRQNEDIDKPTTERALYDVTDLLRRLACFNNDLFPWAEDKHPTKAYSGVGSLVKDFKPAQFERFAHLVPDALWLEDRILEEHLKLNGIGEGKKLVISKVSGCSNKDMHTITGRVLKDLTIADPFILPVLAAFRVFLDDDAQWIKPLKTLWAEFGPKLVDRLWDTYKTEGQSSASHFGRTRTVWAALVFLASRGRDQ